MTVEKRSLLDGLKQLRGGQAGAGFKPAPVVAPPAPRAAMTTRFVTVDPDAHQRSVDAQRAELARQRDLDEASYLLAQRDSDAEETRRIGQGKHTAPNVPTPRRLAAAKPAAKPKQAPPRDPYAHLHADALAVWRCVADHADQHGQPPTLTEIADVTGQTVSMVSHRLRQLENNGILRRGYDGVIVLCVPPVKTAEAATDAEAYVLKPTTARVLAFIVEYIDAQGFTPIQAEICKGCDLSYSVLSHHLIRLETSGYIERGAGGLRDFRLVKRPEVAS